MPSRCTVSPRRQDAIWSVCSNSLLPWFVSGKSRNVLNIIRLSRKTIYVFYLTCENKDENLQNALGSTLMGTCHMSIGGFTSIVIVQTGKIGSICDGSLCAAILHGYHVHFIFLHNCFGKGGGKPLSFLQQSNAQSAPAAKNCISINLSITNTPTCVWILKCLFCKECAKRFTYSLELFNDVVGIKGASIFMTKGICTPGSTAQTVISESHIRSVSLFSFK